MRQIFIGDIKFEDEEKKLLNEILTSTKISENENVKQFERDWSAYTGTNYAVAASSGTAALMLGLQALKYHSKWKLKEGSKIITTPLTYIATTNAAYTTGFKPVYVDIEPETFLIDTEKIAELLEQNSENYSALLPVHLMGYACDMDKINALARKYNLAVIEDACESHGTRYKGKKAGALGDFGAFSFYIAHNIQAGELGAATTNDAELRTLMRRIKGNGRINNPDESREVIQAKLDKISKEYDVEDLHPNYTHDVIGYNFKTMEFPAAIAVCQMKKADWITKTRQDNLKFLNDNLGKYSDILQLPVYSRDFSYLGYPLVIKNPEKISRKKLRAALEAAGIETRPLFGSIPTQQPAYHFLRKEYAGKLPNAEYVGKHGFYIGIHQYLGEEDMQYIADVFSGILKGI